MQRIPIRSLPQQAQRTEPGRGGEPSPMLLLARRIREEQGVEQVRSFLAAMTPFAAPNEIKRIGEGFGIPYESIERATRRDNGGEGYGERRSAGRDAERPSAFGGNPFAGSGSAANGLTMIRTAMQLRTLMSGGGDPEKLLGLLRGNQ